MGGAWRPINAADWYQTQQLARFVQPTVQVGLRQQLVIGSRLFDTRPFSRSSSDTVPGQQWAIRMQFFWR